MTLFVARRLLFDPDSEVYDISLVLLLLCQTVLGLLDEDFALWRLGIVCHACSGYDLFPCYVSRFGTLFEIYCFDCLYCLELLHIVWTFDGQATLLAGLRWGPILRDLVRQVLRVDALESFVRLFSFVWQLFSL